jgi:tetratricopeptide (TPR) repeat protein
MNVKYLQQIMIVLLMLITSFSAFAIKEHVDPLDQEVLYDISHAIEVTKPKKENININYDSSQKQEGSLNNSLSSDAKIYQNIFGDNPTELKAEEKKLNIIKSERFDLSLTEKMDADANIIQMIENAYLASTLGHIEAATTLYENVLRLDHNNQNALIGLASILHQSGVLLEAKKLYSKILSNNPENELALNNFLSLLSEESEDVAIAELQKLEAINHNMGIIPAQIAMIYLKQQNKQMALEYLYKAHTIAPDNSSYKYNLAVLLDQNNKILEAITFYKSLIKDYKNHKTLPCPIDIINNRLFYLSEQMVN